MDYRYVTHTNCHDWLIHSVKKLKGRGVWVGNRHADQFSTEEGIDDRDSLIDGCQMRQPTEEPEQVRLLIALLRTPIGRYLKNRFTVNSIYTHK